MLMAIIILPKMGLQQGEIELDIPCHLSHSNKNSVVDANVNNKMTKTKLNHTT